MPRGSPRLKRGSLLLTQLINKNMVKLYIAIGNWEQLNKELVDLTRVDLKKVT